MDNLVPGGLCGPMSLRAEVILPMCLAAKESKESRGGGREMSSGKGSCLFLCIYMGKCKSLLRE
jgi:hypothetical protein